MSFAEAIKSCFSKYVMFDGRARRSEFWYWFLFVVIVNIVTNVIDKSVGNMAIGGLVSLALLLPNLAVGSRRLHDTGRSGWWQLIALTIVGIILLIVWWAQDPDAADNSHGPSPKGGLAPGLT